MSIKRHAKKKHNKADRQDFFINIFLFYLTLLNILIAFKSLELQSILLITGNRIVLQRWVSRLYIGVN